MKLTTLVTSIALAFTATIAQGEPHAKTPKLKNAPAGWEAVGRLNIGGSNMCTGALIAPNIVLTAAHCLHNPRTGAAVDPRGIQFEAGLKNGRASAQRMVTRAVKHPKYKFGRDTQLGYDLALLYLSGPINNANIVPFGTDARPGRGDEVGVVSYSLQQSNTARIEQPCHVLARQHDTLVMSCDVEFGASGAPVFAVTNGKRPQLVSVISAKAEMNRRKVSIGTALEGTLKMMLNLG